jgi:hypothetical protein
MVARATVRLFRRDFAFFRLITDDYVLEISFAGAVLRCDAIQGTIFAFCGALDVSSISHACGVNLLFLDPELGSE